MKKTFKRTMGMAMAAVMSVTMAGVMPAAAEVEYQFDDYLESYFETSLHFLSMRRFANEKTCNCQLVAYPAAHRLRR